MATQTGLRVTCMLAWLALLGAVVAPLHAGATEQGTVGIAVFPFELADKSAGGPTAGTDAHDIRYLREAADQARTVLAESERYRVIDVDPAAIEAVAAAGGLLNCQGCELAVAEELGAERAMLGLVTRITRTEYTLELAIKHAGTGEVLSHGFTGLRMGANYSWPRGIKSLMDEHFVAAANR